MPAAAVRERLADRRLRRMLDAAAVAVGRLAEQTIKAAQARMQATLTPEVERLRWFPLPEEVHCELQGREAPTHCGYHLDAGGS